MPPAVALGLRICSKGRRVTEVIDNRGFVNYSKINKAGFYVVLW